MSANIVRIDGNYKLQTTGGTSLNPRTITVDSGTSGTVNIIGNLNVSGGYTSITTTDTDITDNIIFLNVGETGNGISTRGGVRQSGIQIKRGQQADAQILFDENITWDDRINATSKQGLFVLKTANDQISGIRLNYVDTSGGNLYLVSNSGGANTTGIVSVLGTKDYEKQVVDYDVNSNIVIPIKAKHDDIIPNIKSVIDYVSHITAVGNVSVTQNGGTLTIGVNKTATISNTLTFIGADGSTINFGGGGLVGYFGSSGNKLSDFAATTSSELASVISDETGSGLLVFATSPTLVTPTLGVATATSINSLTISTSTGTLTIANGKTFTVNNTLTFNATDSSSVNFRGGGNIGYIGSNGNKLSDFASTTSSELASVISDETGSGALVFATSPTLVTPTLGVATATTINKVTITAPATGSTLTIAEGKTLTASNSVTFTSTDASETPSVAFGLGGTVTYTRNKLSAFSATTSAELAGVISDETGTGLLVFGTSPTITTSLVTDSTSFNLINATATTVNFAGAATALTIGNATTATVTLNPGTLVGANTTQNVYNTVATTVNAFGNATTANIGYTGSQNVNTFTQSYSSGYMGSNTTSTVNISNGYMGSGSTNTINVGTGGVNNSSTIINLGNGSGLSNINIGSEFAGSTTIKSSIVVGYLGSQGLYDSVTTIMNFAGAATSLNIGSSSSATVTLRPGTLVGANTTQNVYNTVATTVNAFGVAGLATIGYSGSIFTRTFIQNYSNGYIGSNATSTVNISTGYMGSGSTNTINVGNGGVVNSSTTLNLGTGSGTTTVNVGSDIGGITTIKSSIVVGYLGSQSLYNTTATTMNFAGAATSLNIGSSSSATVTLRPGTVVGSNTTQNVYNTIATTVNAFGDATIAGIGYTGSQNTSTFTQNYSTGYMGSNTSSTVNISTGYMGSGSTNTVNVGTGGSYNSTTTVNLGYTGSGSATINIGSDQGGTTTIKSSIVVGYLGSQSLYDTTATTMNFAGAATSLRIGNATSATVTLRPGTLIGSNTTQNVYNTVATTVNAFGAAETANIGYTGSATSVAFTQNYSTGYIGSGATNAINIGTGGVANSATTITIGSTNNTTNTTIYGHVTLEGTTSTGSTGTGKLVFGTSPTLTTSLVTDSTTFGLINATATTVNFAGAATTIGIGASTGTITLGNQILTGTNLYTFNMNGVSPLTIATSTSGSTANLFNTNVTTANLFGASTTTNLALSGSVNIGSSSSATTTLTLGGAISGNTFKIAGTASGTTNVSSDVTTGTLNLFTGLTTATMNIGSAATGKVSLAFTTQSTSTTTGSFVTAGGIGVAKNLYLGGNATMIYQNSDPTNDSTGVILYSKNSNLSNTGLYFVNSTMSGELISKKKALAYSIVFG